MITENEGYQELSAVPLHRRTNREYKSRSSRLVEKLLPECESFADYHKLLTIAPLDSFAREKIREAIERDFGVYDKAFKYLFGRKFVTVRGDT